MWKHVLPPVVLVIVIWISISLATSVYITYTERVHQKILDENVTSIEAASDLQAMCWKLISENLEDSQNRVDLESRVNASIDGMERLLVSLRDSASTTREQQLLKDVQLNLEAIDSARGSQDRNTALSVIKRDANTINSCVKRMAETCIELRQYNSQLIKDEDAKQKVLFTRMMFLRNFTLILGPIVGVVVGWRITTQLQSRVSTLAITLRSVASNTVYTVGEFSLKGADDLREIQHLSEKVVTQMQKIGRDLERAELEIIQSERLAAVGELAAGIAHELRNPLTSVKLLLQHAVTESDRGNISLANMELILSEIGRMEETIQNLLDFSRPPNLTCRIHDVLVPLQRAITLISGRAIASKVILKLCSNGTPLFVNGDIEQLHLVFVNLLINAVESMPTGGEIVVEAQHTSSKKSVCVSIRDKGCGIAPEVAEHLFEPFNTTKERGTGLGLALCHRIVGNHSGIISGVNHPSGGSVFRIELPSATQVSLEEQLILRGA